MNCQHCYAETFAQSKLVELDILRKAIDEAYDLGVHHYILQGGEPICDRDRLERIIHSLYVDEAYVNVVSNGWVMTKECIRWLKGLKVDKIALSLDSGVEQEHDRHRRNGSFKRVLQAVDDVLSEGLFASISTVVTRQSIHSVAFESALKIAKSKGIRIDVQIAMPVGKWDGKKEYLVTSDDARYIKKLQAEYPVLPNGQKMINRDIFNFGGPDHCPAGTEFMAITSDGHFLPCNFCQFTLGSIKDKSLAEMRSDLLNCDLFNSEYSRCLVGEDELFIDKYIMPYINEQKPLDAYRIFNL
jgi:MoaA/NifB/PqqE/SkfB family radical SAM enzyme